MANKLKSKSLVLENIIEDLDEQLSSIPSHDFDGCPIEESMQFDNYIDGIANIRFIDGIGRKHYPINKTIATILVYDELKLREDNTNNGDK